MESTLWTYFFTFLVHVLVILGVNVYLRTRFAHDRQKYSRLATFLLIFLIALQLLFAFAYRLQVGDIMIQTGPGRYLRQGVSFYYIDPKHEQHPYLPFMVYVFAVLNFLEEKITFVTFSFLLKVVLTVPLFLISFLIKRRIDDEGDAKKDLENDGTATQLQFLAHPITTMVVFFHGQFDVMLLGLFIFSVLFIFKKELQYFIFGVALFTASILTKTWSIIFMPLLFWNLKPWWRKFALPFLVFGGIVADVVVYTKITEGSRLMTVLPSALKAGGPMGEWGISFFLSPIQAQVKQYNLIIFAVLFGLLLLPILLTKKTFWHKCVLIILAVYITIPNWGIQYLFWILPFVYLSGEHKSRQFWLFTVLGTISMFGYYTNVIWDSAAVPKLPLYIFSLSIWAVCIWWYWKLYRKDGLAEPQSSLE